MAHSRDIVGFADEMLAAYDRAAATLDEPVERTVRLASRTVRMRFAAPELAARFSPAFAALEAPADAPPDLSISCWERTATGVLPPQSPFEQRDYLHRGVIRGHIDDRIRVMYDQWLPILIVYDRDRREAGVFFMDHASVPAWCDRAPFRTVIRWWADDCGLVPLHASAVATDGGAVVITGASGAGKSTSALACVAAGWGFIADDLCLITPGPEPVVYPVFGVAKLEPDALERLPSLATFIADPTAEQLVLNLAARVVTSAEVRALLLPQIVSRATTRVVPISAGEALRALVPGSVLEGVGVGNKTLPTLVSLLRNARCDRLELGHDLDGVVATLRAVAGGG